MSTRDESLASNVTGVTASAIDDDALKNKRLATIREEYEYDKQTPDEQLQGMQKAGDELIEGMRRRGVSEDVIQNFMADMAAADAAAAQGKALEDERDRIKGKIATATIGGITITSEGSRHWRIATVDDFGSIVYLPGDKEFGEFDDIGEEPDEEFPDESHTTAIVYTFSGDQKSLWAFGGKFEEMLLVPNEVLKGVKDEAPPGRFFSGKSITSSDKQSTWSPAPDGQTWVDKHPFLKIPNGKYMTDGAAFLTKLMIDCPGMTHGVMAKAWMERGLLAYWCPVLKRFISQGERFRQEHWFHNGDGSANQRYFYDQNEMIDRHGGLKCLPKTMDDIEDIRIVGVLGCADAVAKRVREAEAKGNVVDVDIDSKMPAKPSY